MEGAEPITAESGPARSRSGLDDAELVRRAKLGSAAAFEELVVRHGPRLHRYLVVRLGEADAPDALQETLTAAWLGLPRLRADGKFWPWLVGIAVRKAADATRRRTAVAQGIPERARPDEGPHELLAALDALPDHLRSVLLLRHLLGLSESEAATALGVRVGTIKSRSARARAALGRLLR